MNNDYVKITYKYDCMRLFNDFKYEIVVFDFICMLINVYRT